EEEGTSAISLRCVASEGSSNLVAALGKREIYGRKSFVSRRFLANIYFSKLKCVSTFTVYNFEKSKWEQRILPTEPRDYLGQKGFVLGLSSDSTYLVMMQTGPRKSTAVIYFLLLSPNLAIHKNHIIIRDYTPLTGLRVYFHPCSRFVCTFVYNESHFQSALRTGLSEASAFHVYTMFPNCSICLHYSTSATIVVRGKPKRWALVKKSYLRVHSNGFILNTGVTIVMVLFSSSLPTQLKYKQKVWRVVLQQTPSLSIDQRHTIVCDLGEEISVESSMKHDSDVAGLSYKLVDCEKEEEYCDPKFACGLRKPFFVSRHVVCIESLIDRFICVFIRTSPPFKGSVYRVTRDYETDVNHVDRDGICKLVILCVSELQVPMGNGESTRNAFYLFQIQVIWSVFEGWKVGGKCKAIKELRPEVVFNVSTWYPYTRFPVEKDEYSYYIPNWKVAQAQAGGDQRRILSVNEDMEVILNLDEL
ncbi:hypothetical protein V3C99_012486, partial [Haemonchus contortus]